MSRKKEKPYKLLEVPIGSLRVREREPNDARRFERARHAVESGDPLQIWVLPVNDGKYRVLIGNIFVHAIRNLPEEKYLALFPNDTVSVSVRTFGG